MKFDVFKHRLIKLKNKSLPGFQSHLELAPKNRIQLLKSLNKIQKHMMQQSHYVFTQI